MLEFLWNVPIVLFDFALNIIFWGIAITLLVLILKWGTEQYIEKFRKTNLDDDDYEPYKDNYENTRN